MKNMKDRCEAVFFMLESICFLCLLFLGVIHRCSVAKKLAFNAVFLKQLSSCPIELSSSSFKSSLNLGCVNASPVEQRKCFRIEVFFR